MVYIMWTLSVAESGRNPVSKQIQADCAKLAEEVEPVVQDQILRRERGKGKHYFPCAADHEQDWQPYPIDPYYFVCWT